MEITYFIGLVLLPLLGFVTVLAHEAHEAVMDDKTKPVKRAPEDYAKWEAEKIKRCMPSGR